MRNQNTDDGSPKDICERLREYRAFVSPESRTLNLEAAAEIERLNEANDLLCDASELAKKGARQDALEEAAAVAEKPITPGHAPNCNQFVIAKRIRALKETP